MAEDPQRCGEQHRTGGITIGRFREIVDDFIEEYALAYAESTTKDRRRELMRICTMVESLATSGGITTEDPGAFTMDDVKVIAARFKRMDISSNTRGHLLGRLNMICKFSGNMAVELAKVRYPTLFPPKKETRLDVLDAQDIERIRAFADSDHDFQGLRACASIMIPLSTGLRPQEVRYVRDVDFNIALTELRVEHPKGEDAYGLVRVVPIHPDGVPAIRRYLDAFHASGRTGYIFQGPHGDGLPVAGNTQRKWREYVEKGTGLDLDHRILRRTWGQMLLDSGVPEECVSVLLGHASTETTNRYYARTRERAAIAAVRELWETSSQTRSEKE